VQNFCDCVEVVVEQVCVGIECDVGRRVPEHPLQRQHVHPSTFTPADTARDAQVWRRSWGVMACLSRLEIHEARSGGRAQGIRAVSIVVDLHDDRAGEGYTSVSLKQGLRQGE
jgi:hypothetical protein